MASEGVEKNPFRDRPRGLAGIRLIPRWDLTYPLHRVDHPRPDPECVHPDCVVRDVMES